MDNNLMEILVYVYFGSTVNNRPENWQNIYNVDPILLKSLDTAV